MNPSGSTKTNPGLRAEPWGKDLKGVPRGRIAVHDDASVRIERGLPPLGEQQRLGQDLLGAGTVEVLPQTADKLVEPTGLVQGGREPAGHGTRHLPRLTKEAVQRLDLRGEVQVPAATARLGLIGPAAREKRDGERAPEERRDAPC